MPVSKFTELAARANKLGDSILQAASDEDVLSHGDAFVKSCEEVIAYTQGTSDSSWKTDDLREFQVMHLKIAKRVELALESTKQALRDNQKRGKGIKKYAISEVNNALVKQQSFLNRKKM